MRSDRIRFKRQRIDLQKASSKLLFLKYSNTIVIQLCYPLVLNLKFFHLPTCHLTHAQWIPSAKHGHFMEYGMLLTINVGSLLRASANIVVSPESYL